ncbi:MAG: 30S ribosomal protein S16 [Acidimicrobiia bacterium]|nr:30S ribosomal protein S16 [Acidimicrobiia bacterium]MDH5420665.1 30S ribosomal protein S16 [Acidimicrobiia bacterium]MDH5505144.1 30S ribosomal protein S16 [Acidimicrobiia bacterium]
MAVKIRLMRLGKKKQPVYRVVVADGRQPRDGSYIDAIGRYDPRQEPSLVEIDNDKAVTWLNDGAQPTEAARKLLEISGAWSQFKISRGEIHTIAAKPTPKQETPAPEQEESAPVVADEPAAESDEEE